MGQIFKRHTNTLAKLSIVLGGVFVISLLVLAGVLHRSPYYTQVGVPKQQVVPFSHKHHVQGLGIDCRFCHTSVETSSFAGIPPTETCMKCHSQLWNDAPILEPIRESYKTGKPIEWVRVHDLPDYVYFNHSIHISKGVSCTSCHGQVDEMPLMWKEKTLHMQFCLDCHNSPEEFLRPKEHVFDMNWHPKVDQKEMGRKLMKEYGIGKNDLKDCSVCHR